jgi:putative transcriptional regulator
MKICASGREASLAASLRHSRCLRRIADGPTGLDRRAEVATDLPNTPSCPDVVHWGNREGGLRAAGASIVQPEPIMSSKAFHRAGVIVAAMLATLLAAALPAPTAAPQRASLVGQLLVASPSMGDPRFYQTVIVLAWHENSGAMGIVVNRPLKERPVAALLEALGEKADGAAGNVRLFAGGPVEPDRGFVVHSAEYRRADTMAIDAQLAMTASREILRDIAMHRGPKQSLVAFGYAGWGPGQLEGELAQRF